MLACQYSQPKRPGDLESGVRVTCDMGYLLANFSFPRLFDLGPMYATDRRQTRIIAYCPLGGSISIDCRCWLYMNQKITWKPELFIGPSCV